MGGSILVDTRRQDSTNYRVPRGLLWYTNTILDRVVISLSDTIAPLSAIITSTNILRMHTAIKQARKESIINIAINTGASLDLQVAQALVIAQLISVSIDNMKNLQAHENSSRLRGMYECLLAFAGLYHGTYIAKNLELAKKDEVYNIYRDAKTKLNSDASRAVTMYMKNQATYKANAFKSVYQHQVEGILKLGALSQLTLLDKQIAVQKYAANNGIELLTAMKSIIDDCRPISVQDLINLYNVASKGSTIYSAIDKAPELIDSEGLELIQLNLS